MADREEKGATVRSELLFCLFLLALIGVFGVAMLGYAPATRRAPLVVTVPLLLMVIGQTVSAAGKYRKWRSESAQVSLVPEFTSKTSKKGTQILVWLVVLLLAIYVGGHLAGIAVFLFVFLRWVSRESLRVAASVAVGVPVAMYFLFEQVLMIQLYQGAVFLYLSDWLQS